MDALAVFALMLFVFGGISYALISSHMAAVERKNIGNLSPRDTNSKYFGSMSCGVGWEAGISIL